MIRHHSSEGTKGGRRRGRYRSSAFTSFRARILFFRFAFVAASSSSPSVAPGAPPAPAPPPNPPGSAPQLEREDQRSGRDGRTPFGACLRSGPFFSPIIPVTGDPLFSPIISPGSDCPRGRGAAVAASANALVNPVPSAGFERGRLGWGHRQSAGPLGEGLVRRRMTSTHTSNLCCASGACCSANIGS